MLSKRHLLYLPLLCLVLFGCSILPNQDSEEDLPSRQDSLNALAKNRDSLFFSGPMNLYAYTIRSSYTYAGLAIIKYTVSKYTMISVVDSIISFRFDRDYLKEPSENEIELTGIGLDPDYLSLRTGNCANHSECTASIKEFGSEIGCQFPEILPDSLEITNNGYRDYTSYTSGFAHGGLITNTIEYRWDAHLWPTYCNILLNTDRADVKRKYDVSTGF